MIVTWNKVNVKKYKQMQNCKIIILFQVIANATFIIYYSSPLVLKYENNKLKLINKNEQNLDIFKKNSKLWKCTIKLLKL